MKTDRSFDDLQLPQKFSPNSSGRHSRSSYFGLSPPPRPQTSVLSGSSQARWLTKILTLPTFSHFPVLAEDFPSASGIFPNPTPPPPAWPWGFPPLPCGHLCITVGNGFLLRSYLVFGFSLSHLTQPHAEWSFLLDWKFPEKRNSILAYFVQSLSLDGLGWIGLQTR